MDFLQLVKEARTCRRFDQNKPLTRDDIYWLLECARLAPCSRNAQDILFIAIGNGRMCNEVFKYVNWAGSLKDWSGPEEGERPTAFIALLAPEGGRDVSAFDAGIAAQTIQLAAASRGWGCCIILSCNKPRLSELMGVPQRLELSLMLALGVAREKRVIDEQPHNGSWDYWRDNAQVHHVPKKALRERIIKEFLPD